MRERSETLRRCGVPLQELSRAELERRYPQIALDGIAMGLLEPQSGVLMARRAVAAVVEDAVRRGAEYRVTQIAAPREAGRVSGGTTASGEGVEAERIGFCCGAALGQ